MPIRSSLSPSALRRGAVVSSGGDTDDALSSHEHEVMDEAAIATGDAVKLSAWHGESFAVLPLCVSSAQDRPHPSELALIHFPGKKTQQNSQMMTTKMMMSIIGF